MLYLLSPEGQSLLATYDYGTITPALVALGTAAASQLLLANGVTPWAFESDYAVGASILVGSEGTARSVISGYRMSLVDFEELDAFVNYEQGNNITLLSAQLTALRAQVTALRGGLDPASVVAAYRQVTIAALVVAVFSLCIGMAAFGLAVQASGDPVRPGLSMRGGGDY